MVDHWEPEDHQAPVDWAKVGPSLLAALEEAEQFLASNLEGEDPRYQPWCATWDKVRAAIAKARNTAQG